MNSNHCHENSMGVIIIRVKSETFVPETLNFDNRNNFLCPAALIAYCHFCCEWR